MSVLNQSGEEQVECPLCMEPLEVDDINFFPCTCLYQICRFCWHRIRTDENGLCPACRKAYPEDPADFKPLSQEEVAKMKAEKRQKDHQRKQKITENRKHLANVRVVQRNLVFVVGLPMRLADAEILKKHEYFGKFGKIHKVVINHSTTYAGSQGPSASAYVTYQRSEDALRAIQSVNNIVVDTRILKTSLGTTKYCSHFMKNQSCPKQDCMYLHEMGDREASFTKEEMQQGKHQEFEKKLHDQLIKETAANNNNNSSITNNNSKDRKNSASPPINTIIITPTATSDDVIKNADDSNDDTSNDQQQPPDITQQNKEVWPSFSQETLPESTGTSPTPSSVSSDVSCTSSSTNDNIKKHNGFGKRDINRAMSSNSNSTSTSSDDINIMSMAAQLLEEEEDSDQQQQHHHHLLSQQQNNISTQQKLSTSPQILQNGTSTTNITNQQQQILNNILEPPQQQQQQMMSSHPMFNDNSSFFSSSTSSNNNMLLSNTKLPPPNLLPTQNVDLISNTLLNTDWSINGLTHLPDVLPPIHSSEDWQAAFGFRTTSNNTQQHQQHHLHTPNHMQQQQQQQHNPIILANHLNNTQQQMTSNHHVSSRHHDDDLGFDPFLETQKGLAEIIEKEERLRLNNSYQQQLQQQQQQQNILSRERERIAQQLQAQTLQALQQHQNSTINSFFDNNNIFSSPPSSSSSHFNNNNNTKLNNSTLYNNTLANCTKLFDNFVLGNNNNQTSNNSLLSNQIGLNNNNNSSLTNGNNNMTSRSRFGLPPPGFTQPNLQMAPPSLPHQQLQQHNSYNNNIQQEQQLHNNSNSNNYMNNSTAAKFIENTLGMDSLMVGTKLLPFSTSTNPNNSSSLNFSQHSLNHPAPSWDWTALDPAIMSTGQHCDLFTTPPPPGFSLRQTTLDNF